MGTSCQQHVWKGHKDALLARRPQGQQGCIAGTEAARPYLLVTSISEPTASERRQLKSVIPYSRTERTRGTQTYLLADYPNWQYADNAQAVANAKTQAAYVETWLKEATYGQMDFKIYPRSRVSNGQ